MKSPILPRPPLARRNHPVFQDTRFEPFTDQADDAPVADPALRLQHHEPSLRLVYPAASWEVERSTQPGTLILTLRTSDNFHVSFGVTANDLQDMAEAVSSGVGDAALRQYRRQGLR